jgi:cytochrome c551
MHAKFSRRVGGLGAVLMAVGVAGCGTANTTDLLVNIANAAATTTLDLALSGAANSFAGCFEPCPPCEDEGDGNGDGNGGGNGGGDPGQQVYLERCAGCHGANGEGGSGPPLAGVDWTDRLQELFGGGQSHFGATLTDQEIADVAAWLASL